MKRYDKCFAKLKKMQRINAAQVRKVAKKLKLPIIKTSLPELPALSPDDCIKFILFNWKHLPHPRLGRKEEMRLRVNVPFVKK